MLPAGMILLWYGAIGAIPAGYALCNGANGTPDLRDKFIIGAGSTYAVGAEGGAATHDHAFSDLGHTHDIPGGAAIGAGANFSATTNAGTASGTTDPGSSLPPSHALAYILKT